MKFRLAGTISSMAFQISIDKKKNNLIICTGIHFYCEIVLKTQYSVYENITIYFILQNILKKRALKLLNFK